MGQDPLEKSGNLEGLFVARYRTSPDAAKDPIGKPGRFTQQKNPHFHGDSLNFQISESYTSFTSASAAWFITDCIPFLAAASVVYIWLVPIT